MHRVVPVAQMPGRFDVHVRSVPMLISSTCPSQSSSMPSQVSGRLAAASGEIPAEHIILPFSHRCVPVEQTPDSPVRHSTPSPGTCSSTTPSQSSSRPLQYSGVPSSGPMQRNCPSWQPIKPPPQRVSQGAPISSFDLPARHFRRRYRRNRHQSRYTFR